MAGSVRRVGKLGMGDGARGAQQDEIKVRVTKPQPGHLVLHRTHKLKGICTSQTQEVEN